jgi:flagellar protein FliS
MQNASVSYRENATRGASAIRLVILLYEQMIRDLTLAAQALEQNDIEGRTRYINHAVLVIGYLQSPLDFERGGKVARDLENLYDFLRHNLVQVQCNPSAEGFGRLITDLLTLRETWIEVERREAPPSSLPGVTPEAPHAHWKG